MIYQFKGGPEDGGELAIAERQMGSIFEIYCAVDHQVVDTHIDFPLYPLRPRAQYRVTDIGEMTFEGYS